MRGLRAMVSVGKLMQYQASTGGLSSGRIRLGELRAARGRRVHAPRVDQVLGFAEQAALWRGNVWEREPKIVRLPIG